ncbi:MAG: hypothetical protein IJ480_05835 [Clostridia bacterium]|nr:hypothetical protein [Clostridia bacterium]
MVTNIQTAPQHTLARPMSYEAYKSRLWNLAERFPVCQLQTIGVTAAGRSLYAMSVGGEGDLPSAAYIGGISGGDWLSAAVLLRFLEEYSRLLEENGRLYRVHLPALFTRRRICVCPMVNWDAAELFREKGEENPDSYRNGLGADLTAFFADGKEAPEKCPEAVALRQYLLYQTPGVLVCVRGGGKGGLTIPKQPSPRAGAVGRLLSRMLTLPEYGEPDTSAAIPAWYAAESGRPAYCVSLGESGGEDSFYRGYAAVRELLYSAPLLI